MKKVLFVIDSLTCGGAEKSLVSLLPLLDQNKYEVSLWLRSHSGSFLPLVPEWVKIVDQPHYSPFEKFLFFVGRILYSFAIRWNKLISKKEHPAETLYKAQGWSMKIPDGQWDTVVAYQQGVPTYLVAEKFTNCKKIAWINADIFKAGYNIEYNSRYYRKFDYINAVSDNLLKILEAKMPEFAGKYVKILDILNPIIIKQLAEEHVVSLRPIDNSIVLITTGRLAPPKGYDIAIEAANFLKCNGIKFRWYFIGEGSERDSICKGIEKYNLLGYVFLLGLKTNPYAYMKQADIYVQTSKFEGFGLTIGEAKILGLPVVSTNFEVVHNQLTHEQNGLIADMNGESVAKNIIRLAEDVELRQRIIANVKQEVNTTSVTEISKVETIL